MDSTHQATWSGGPWDGITVEVVRGEEFFPIYGPSPRMCRVSVDSNGRWIIDWNDAESAG